MPKVSVIIPSYNHADFVESAINSVLHQSLQDFEIIVTDDGSTDGTADLVSGINDPRIDLVRFEDNRGACVAANECIKRSAGEFIAMLSSDDEFLPDKLEQQVKFLNAHHKFAAVFSSVAFIDEKGNRLYMNDQTWPGFSMENRSQFQWLNHFFHKGNALCHPTALIRRSTYDEIGTYDPRYAAVPDLEMWVRLCLRHEIYILEENLVRYRVLPKHSNASSPTFHNQKRLHWEMSLILEHYLRPEYLKCFKEIFPEWQDGPDEEWSDERKIERLAMEALQIGFPFQNAFALRALHSLKQTAKGKAPRLHKLAAEVEVSFTQTNPILQIAWTDDEIFEAENIYSIEYPANSTQNISHTFFIPGEKFQVRIIPDPQPTFLTIESIVIKQSLNDKELLRINTDTGLPSLCKTTDLIPVPEQELSFISFGNNSQILLQDLTKTSDPSIQIEVNLTSSQNLIPLVERFSRFNDTIIESKRVPELEHKHKSVAHELGQETLKHQNTLTKLHEETLKHQGTATKLHEETLKHQGAATKLHEETLKHQNTEGEKILLQDKVHRMKDSFSWKISAPLRYLRRQLLDRFQVKTTPPIQDSCEESPSTVKPTYSEWIKLYDTLTDDDLEIYRNRAKSMKEKPLLSVIMPVFDPPEKFLRNAIDSVLIQIYENWELCISDDASTKPHVRSILKEYADRDSRIKIVYRKNNGHISEASNSAAEIASGKFLVLLDHDDELRPHSLYWMAKTIIKHTDVILIYSDEDKIDGNDNRFDPFFKSDWNPDLLRAQNYICHLVALRRHTFADIGGFRKGFEGSQDWDLLLRVTENLSPEKIVHIPHILYHWRATASSTALSNDSKQYAAAAAEKALREHYLRTGSTMEPVPLSNGYFGTRNLSENSPTTTIIIPTRNGGKVLKRCVESIIERTAMHEYQILIVDNGSDEEETLNLLKKLGSRFENITIQRDPSPFNYSAINNRAAKSIDSEVLIFLNDDTEILKETWLSDLSMNSIRKGIGAVGGKLLYPNGKIQHAGVILGIGGVAGHAFRTLPTDYTGQMNRANITHNISAITGACLAVERQKFLSVAGFDQENLAIAFNDVDLCLKLMEKGFRNLYLPEVKLVHHESYSRGLEDNSKKIERFKKETAFMLKRWKQKLQNDPNYNPNLSLENEQFSLNGPVRNLA